MNKLTEKNAVVKMTILFTVLYMVSYLTRINYGAVISELVEAENLQKSAASLALTASAVTYGVGQLVSGFLGDRVNPKKLIFSGLIVTMLMNAAIPFCTATWQMASLWAVNGLAQAFMWPPLVKLMTSLFTENDYKKSCTYVSWGASIGTILVYAFSPLCIHIAGWRSVFALSALCAAAMALVWMKKCPNICGENVKKATETHSRMNGKTAVIIAVIMLVIALQGVLRDGVTTWMPSYISETFNLSNKTAILTGVILPVFSIATLQFVSWIYRKFVKNELFLAGIWFAVGFASAAALYFTSGASAAVSVLLAAILEGSMHGVNIMMTCMVPPYFGKYGKISLISGTLNFCTYVGSAVSGVGLAAFSEKYEWSGTLVLWSVIALAGFLICLGICGIWNRLKKNAV